MTVRRANDRGWRRAARAVPLLASGWLLVQPPWSTAPGAPLAFDATRPVAEWERESAYADAATCETARRRLLKLFVCGAGAGDETDEIGSLAAQRLVASRCVPTEPSR